MLHNIVSKDIIAESLEMGQHLNENQVFEWLVFLFRLARRHERIDHLAWLILCVDDGLLDEPASLLVNRAFINMRSDNSVVKLLFRLDFVDEA